MKILKQALNKIKSINKKQRDCFEKMGQGLIEVDWQKHLEILPITHK